MLKSVTFRTIVVAFACAIALSAHARADTSRKIEIPAGELADALRMLGEQSGAEFVYSAEELKGIRTDGLQGEYTTEKAVTRLLDGTKLKITTHESGAILISRPQAALPFQTSVLVADTGSVRLAQTDSTQAGNNRTSRFAGNQSFEETPSVVSEGKTQEVAQLERLTVTGTRIRGVQLTSPLVAISQEDMFLSGHSNLGQALRALPQNFSGGQNPGVVPGSGGLANQNITGSSSVNLRGLGPDATLTLLNGVRMAYDGYIQGVDLSVVPAAAIDRVEVLLDGASAIYGSDAVGGVVNTILKRDYDGAELSARYGDATDGGYAQTQFTGVAGTTWVSGGFLISADATSNNAVLASQRDYLDYIENPDLVSVYPETSQTSVLFSGHQRLGSRAELGLDTYYLDRSSSYGMVDDPFAIEIEPETSVYGVSPSLTVDLPREWSLRLLGFSGESDARLRQIYNLVGETDPILDSLEMYRNQTHAASVELEGPLFGVPAGDTRLSLGGGWRKSEFEYVDLTSGSAIVPTSSNSNRYGYAEIDVPLVADDQEIKFVRRLSLNGALRHEDYDSFGSETTPKLGAIWSVTTSFDIRASWGESFKAPTLTQQYFPQFVLMFPASSYGVTDAPPDATVLRAIGGNPNLDPERAEVTTAGVAFRPSFVPGLTLELGWFDIDYTQRVVRPLSFPSPAQFGPTLDDPAYSDFSIRNPSAALQSELISSAQFVNLAGVEYDPAAVAAFFDDREVNAASQVVRGIDLGLQYAISAFGGTFSVNANGSWLTDAERTVVEGGPESETAGVLGYPPEFKGRLGADWSKSALTLAAAINHIGGIRNTVLTPSPKGDAMTTLDLIVDYRAEPGVFGGFGFNLAIMNALNQSPPHLQPSQPYFVNFDSTNYSAIGRTISLTVSKKF